MEKVQQPMRASTTPALCLLRVRGACARQTHVHAPNFASDAFCNTPARGPVGDAVQELDYAVEQLLAALDALQIDQNTVVFFTSDNGAPLPNDYIGNGMLRDGKFTTWGAYAVGW